jgi:AbiU2
MPKPTLAEMLKVLKRQILIGKSYLAIAKGLQAADPVILSTAPTFFGLTMDGGIELVQLVVARVYDRTPGTVTMMSMLHEAACRIREARKAGQVNVGPALLQCAQRAISLQPIIDSIRRRRNKWLAHLDPEIVRDPRRLSERAKLTIPDLELVLDHTEQNVLKISNLYEGITGKLSFIGGDDFLAVLEWLRKARCEFIANFEKEFERPWDGQKPARYTTDNFAMWE